MKKILTMMLTGLLVVACEKPYSGDVGGASEQSVNSKDVKKFTFTVKGEFGAAVFASGNGEEGIPAYQTTRAAGYLAADGQDMTDLWVFDFAGGECVQTVHQTQADGDDWGKPQMSLTYGSHHVYFVASRGTTPTVDETAHAITWARPSDTFWKDYEVSVASTSNGNRAVTLDRVATRLRVTVNDEVPAGCKTIVVTPERWNYGLDYVNGVAVSSQQTDRTVTVPDSYVGTAGQLAVNIFGLSGSNEWVTNVSVKAKDADGNVIGSAQIVGAPFKANRSTDYSGNLFGSGGRYAVSVNGDWETAQAGTW